MNAPSPHDAPWPLPPSSSVPASEPPLPSEPRTPDILVVALLLGAFAALAEVDGGVGANASLVLIATAGAGAWVWSRVRSEEERPRRIGFVGASVLAVGFAVTENDGLRLFDSVAIAVLLSLPLLRSVPETLRHLRPLVLGHAICELVLYGFLGGILALVGRITPPSGLRRAPEVGSAPGPVIAGVALAGLLVCVFGALLCSADAGFDAWVGRNVEPTWLLGRGLITLVVAAVTTGLLHGWTERSFGRGAPFPARDPVQLAGVTILIPLGALAVLFGTFVVFQVRTLFPGGVPDPGTLSAVARRGFFELVGVGGLSLLVLLVGDSCLRWASRPVRTGFVSVASVLLLLVAAILASAAWRMDRYVEYYGWTELRLFASVFLLWTALTLPWFAATALRGDPRRFTAGALVAALALGGLLHVANPEAIIVASHLDRDRTPTTDVDHAYLRTLGVGAIPALVARDSRIPEEEREAYRARWRSQLGGDLPVGAVTLARARAERAVSGLVTRESDGTGAPQPR